MGYRRRSLAVAFAFAMVCSTACGGYVVRASDGSVGGPIPRTGFGDLETGLAGALATSAAHDIRCSEMGLALVSANYNADLYTVEGCGQRVTYTFDYRPVEHGESPRLVLIGRVPTVGWSSNAGLGPGTSNP